MLFPSERRTGPGKLGVAYTGSPFSDEVPFPDYTTCWETYPRWLLDLQRQPPSPWEEKQDSIVVVGGGTRNSKLRMVLFGGACDNAFKATGSTIHMVGVHGGKNVTLNGNSAGFQRLAFVPRRALCQYKVIVLSQGHSRWLDHMKYMLLCKSLVVMLADDMSQNQVALKALGSAYGPLDRIMEPGVTHMELHLNHSDPDTCSYAARQLEELMHHHGKAQAVAKRGEAIVREQFSMQAIYDYVHALFTRLGAIQARRVNISAFIEQHGGVEVTHESYDRLTKRSFDKRIVTWQNRTPAGEYDGWQGAAGAMVAMQALRDLVKRSVAQ